MSITLVDASSDSLTVAWPETKGAVKYILQYRQANNTGFETLSDKLSGTQARKKNLVDERNHGFVFRSGAYLEGQETPTRWMTHPDPFHLLSANTEKNRMPAPTLAPGGAPETLRVSWKAAPGASRYELQMRENTPGVVWKTIAASLSGTEVKKKNLTSKKGYQFRVRPAGTEAAFSHPSGTLSAVGLSEGVKNLFRSLENGTLLRSASGKSVPVEDALAGKEFILLYASASWCGPCKTFTPRLSEWYNAVARHNNVEIIHLSADHDAKAFRSYFSHMPFLAVDYDDDAREKLMTHIKVTGIPQLAVIDGRTGIMIEHNASALEISRWRSMVS